MTASTSRSLVFSILIHGGVITVALLLMMPASREQVAVPQAFEIFSVPAQSQFHAPSNPATSGPAVKFPAVPVPVPRRVVPVTETVDEPVQQPVPAHRVTPPVVQTTPERISPRTTASAFQRQHPSTSKPAINTGSTTAPQHARINLAEVLSGSGSERAQPAVATDPAQEANYWDMLQAKLRDAHEKPAGLDDGLKVRVEFVLRADGSLGDVRVISSSGNAAFDTSVLAAFRRVRGLGIPPSSKVGLNQVTFRTQAE